MSGGRDGAVDGPPIARGASGDWRSERGENRRCADVQSDNSSKVLRKVLRAAALCSTAQGRVKPAVSLVHPCPLESKQAMEGCGGLLEGQKL